MGFRDFKKRFNRAAFRFSIKNQIDADRSRDGIIEFWNERDGTNRPTTDAIAFDTALGHPDKKWAKLYSRMVKSLGSDEALELAKSEFPQHQLNRILP